MAHRVVLVAPGHVPDEIGGSYEDACAVLGLNPVAGGYALYLADILNSRCTVITSDTGRVREAMERLPLAQGGWWVVDLPAVAEVMQSTGLVEVVLGWPEEFGGGRRCSFCRDSDPRWVFDGADVAVVLDEPMVAGLPPDVLGTEVVGCIDWFTCATCRDLVQAGDQPSWHRLLSRYGEEVPLPLRAAWREFWDNHRPATPAPPPLWTPGRRRLAAYSLCTNWDEMAAPYQPGDTNSIDIRRVPAPAKAAAVFEAAYGYVRQPPPHGRVRCYATAVDGEQIVRADGDGWSLVGRTGSPALAYALLDESPYTLCAATDPDTSSLLEDLAALVFDQDQRN